MCGGPISTKSMAKREREYQAEDDLRTLERADEVRADRTRLQRAAGFGRKRMAALQRVTGGGRAVAKRSRARR